jgi:hypothetical protein
VGACEVSERAAHASVQLSPGLVGEERVVARFTSEVLLYHCGPPQLHTTTALSQPSFSAAMAAVMSAKRPRALTSGLDLGGGTQNSRVRRPFIALPTTVRLMCIEQTTTTLHP